MSRTEEIEELEQAWAGDPRWKGVVRPYSAEQVVKLRSTLPVEYSLARHGADTLWRTVNDGELIRALGAVTGNQAVQQVQAGLKGIYVSG
jgi:isocitrate lyase